jgi:trehalose-phosphatase
MTAALMRPAGVDEGFWPALAAAPRALLALDYDGTLAPFRVEREEAVPYPGLAALIADIAVRARTRVVVISGRPAADAARLLGVEPAPEVWGGHGWERSTGGGDVRRELLPALVEQRLAAAATAAAAAGWQERCERKYAGVALHWRGYEEPARAAAAARALLAPLVDGAPLELLTFADGLELRCNLWHKGRVMRRLLDEEPPGTVAAYLGDDRTDEDAFNVLAGGRQGLPVLVAPRWRSTAALAWLRPPQDLRRFLTRWLETRE